MKYGCLPKFMFQQKTTSVITFETENINQAILIVQARLQHADR